MQNLLGTTLDLRVVFNLKTKLPPLCCLLSIQLKSQTSTLAQASPPNVSNIAGYNLAQDKIIYVWDVQRRERAIKAEKERKKMLAKEAAQDLLNSLVCR